MIALVAKYAGITVSSALGLYAVFLGLLATPSFQAHAVYLHKIQMTWFKDLNVPESFGFLRNQVTPFNVENVQGDYLYAWHILPLELYHQHEAEIIQQNGGFCPDFQSTKSFRLLRDDPEAILIIHMHGAAGTVGSGYRVPNYRALSASEPSKIHVLTFDYRGFGKSVGTPSESGLINDASAIVDWAMTIAQIPPARILIFSQSLGTAVNLAIAEKYGSQSPSTIFAGHILVAPFVDTASLVSTYSLAGTIPLLSPLARFPALFRYLSSFVHDKWSSKDRIANYVRNNESSNRKYRLTLVHAKDDYDIPWQHTEKLFWYAVNAASPQAPTNYSDFEGLREKRRTNLGSAGSVMEWKTDFGIIREEILQTGLHDVIMGNPIVTMAVMRILHDG